MNAGRGPERQQGQVMVLFILGIFAIIGMVGLVLDGGSVFAQRRDQQTAADLAAMAGAAAYLNAAGTVDQRKAYAESVAISVATSNGYVEGTAGVDIAFNMNNGSFFNEAVVNLKKPHRNNFAALLGMPTWDVGVTATARSTFQANGARGAMPLMFNAEAFPAAICNEAAGPCTPTVYQLPPPGPISVPQDATTFNWTVMCTAGLPSGVATPTATPTPLPTPTPTPTPIPGNECNNDANTVGQLINGAGGNTVIYLDDNIDPLNAGGMTDLFDDMNGKLGKLFPVPIVQDDGTAVGWGYFRLVSIEGAPDKVITGYFVSPVNGEELVVNGGHTNGTLFTGAYSVRLTN
jgi:Flp pilus assembly protein TadG